MVFQYRRYPLLGTFLACFDCGCILGCCPLISPAVVFKDFKFLVCFIFLMKIMIFIKNPKIYIKENKNHLYTFLAKIIAVNILLDIFSMLVFIYIIILKKYIYGHDSQPGKSLHGKGRGWGGVVDSQPFGDSSQSKHGSLLYSNMTPPKANHMF